MSERNDERQTALELERQPRRLPPSERRRRRRRRFPLSTFIRFALIVAVAFIAWRMFR